MLTGQVFFQLIVILLAVQLCGYLCKRVGQQWVIGEILAGLALGPSLLGAVLPRIQTFIFPASSLPTLQTLGDLGLTLYMFGLGARLDSHLLLGQGRKAVLTSISGIVLPFVLGAFVAFFLFPSLAGPHATQISFLLIVGTAIAITAFPVLARLLTERQMLGTRIGALALTCAAIGDVAAWCLLALATAIVHSQGLFSVAVTIGLLLLFAVGMFLLVRPFLAFVARRVPSASVLAVLSIIVLLGSASVTNALGLHPVFGAFLAGIILPRKGTLVELVRNIDQVNGLLFLPLYFVYSGLHTQIGLINGFWLWLICLLVFAVACGGKIFGTAFPARILGESWHDAFSLGVLMNTRGLVELIVLNIGLQLGVLSPTLFAMLVLMALITTMMASPILPFLGYKQNSSAVASTAQQDVAPAQEQSSHLLPD